MDIRQEKSIAVMSICNTLSLLIRDSVLDVDFIYYQYSNDDEATKAPLQYDMDGDPFFMIGEEAFYINEFMRMNKHFGLAQGF